MKIGLDYAEKLKIAEAAYESDNIAVAISAFEELAEKDVAEACQYLGLIYRTGDGVDKSSSISKRWYSKYVFLLRSKSESGCQSATYALAKLYQYGEHVCQDESKALNMFSELAEDGFVEAQYTLATFFLNGWCKCRVDNSKYKFWLEKSAIADHPEAMYYYGLRLIDDGDLELGESFLLKSASNGFWLAKDHL